jgi:glycerophosphoryl diester phosphodiesterase
MGINKHPALVGFGRLLREGVAMTWQASSGVLLYALLFAVLVSSVILPPLLGLLHALGHFDGDVIVGNYGVLPWVLSGRGLVWGFLLLSSAVFLTVLFFAGLFLLFTLRGAGGSLRRICLVELWKRLPEMLLISGRWSLIIFGAVLILAVVPGLGFLVFLREHDINYYLKSQPAEWWIVIGASAVWVGVTGYFLLRAMLRISLFFPLWVRGHGNLKTSARESWKLTRGHTGRFALLGLVVIVLAALVNMLFNLVLFSCMDALLPTGLGSVNGALAVMVGGVLVFALASIGILCATVAWLCAIWSLLCEELCPKSAGQAPAEFAHGQGRTRIWRFFALTAACVLLVVFILQSTLKLPPQAQREHTLVIAHRGGAGEAPENSVKAFALALERGRADMMEMDVAMSSDEVLILAHDSDLMRQAGDARKLADIPWAEMSSMTLRTPQSKGDQFAPVAKIDEVLRLLKDKRPMIIEFKHSKRTPALVSRTVALVSELGMMDQVLFMSLDLADIREVQRLAPAAKVGYFVSVEMGEFLNLKLNCLAPRHTLVKRKIIAQARERGIPVFAWTVDDPVRVVELLDLGVDGIITNDPSRVKRLVEAYYSIPVEARSLLRFRRLWDLMFEWSEFQVLIDTAKEENLP